MCYMLCALFIFYLFINNNSLFYVLNFQDFEVRYPNWAIKQFTAYTNRWLGLTSTGFISDIQYIKIVSDKNWNEWNIFVLLYIFWSIYMHIYNLAVNIASKFRIFLNNIRSNPDIYYLDILFKNKQKTLRMPWISFNVHCFPDIQIENCVRKFDSI